MSLNTLRKYEAGGNASMENMPLFRDEMAHVQTVGMKHPELAVDAAQVIAKWQGYMNRLKLGLH